MNNILLVANWKMNTSFKEGRELAREIDEEVPEKAEVVICPPFTHLPAIRAQISRLHLGAQDVFWEAEGPYTGEISPLMLKEAGCTYVIIGHSERRIHLGETDEMVNKKVKASLAYGLKPILCLGERLEERERDKTLEIIERQLDLDLEGISDIDGLVIAYEPVWAIGTGRNAEPLEVNHSARYIRQIIEKKYNKKAAKNLVILYGGSVKAENVRSFMEQKEIQGFLVGEASIKGDEFIKIIKISSENI